MGDVRMDLFRILHAFTPVTLPSNIPYHNTPYHNTPPYVRRDLFRILHAFTPVTLR